MKIFSCQLHQLEATQKVIRETTSEIRKVFIKKCDIYLEKRRKIGLTTTVGQIQIFPFHLAMWQ
jgi:hypothetical protein